MRGGVKIKHFSFLNVIRYRMYAFKVTLMIVLILGALGGATYLAVTSMGTAEENKKIEKIRIYVNRLKDNKDFQVAENKLLTIGKPAESHLIEAMNQTKDEDVRKRIESVLTKIKNTPPK